MTSSLATAMMRMGWQQEYLDWLRATFARRAATMVAALIEHMPEWVEYDVPTGGYFVWLRLPPGTDGKALRALANKHGVDVRHGAQFSPTGVGQPPPAELRLLRRRRHRRRGRSSRAGSALAPDRSAVRQDRSVTEMKPSRNQLTGTDRYGCPIGLSGADTDGGNETGASGYLRHAHTRWHGDRRHRRTGTDRRCGDHQRPRRRRRPQHRRHRHPGDRRHRPCGHARLRRHPHPPRRPAGVGSDRVEQLLPRDHQRGDGQLRGHLRACASPKTARSWRR